MNLSVIVPAYNAEATLPALLDSLSAFGFPFAGGEDSFLASRRFELFTYVWTSMPLQIVIFMVGSGSE